VQRFAGLRRGLKFLVEDRFDGCQFVVFELGFEIEFDVERRDVRFVDVGPV